MRLTTAQLESMRRIDIAAIDKDTLVDVSGMTFDNTLPKEQRAANMLAVMKTRIVSVMGIWSSSWSLLTMARPCKTF